jgi:tetratricopeptide (TPR) repeat protein
MLLAQSVILCYAENISPAKIKQSFYHANRLYEEAKYEQAIAEYEKVILQGWESGNIYYNLGNCYFKKGKLGKAILNYEKAKRLIPRDRDLEANYNYALSLVKGGTIGVKRVWFRRVIDKILESFNLRELTLFLSGLSIIMGLFLLAIFCLKEIRKRLLWFLLVFLFVFALVLYATHKKIVLIAKEAVVIVKNSDAKFEPFERATIHFTLYEGMKVKVISCNNGWCKIERADNKGGWVQKGELEIF